MEGEREREGVILCCIIFVQDMKVVLERKKNAEAKEMEKLERKKQLELLKEQVRGCRGYFVQSVPHASKGYQ